MIKSVYKIMVYDADSNTWRTDNWTKHLYIAEMLFRDSLMNYMDRTIKLSRFAYDEDADIDREMAVLKFRGKI